MKNILKDNLFADCTMEELEILWNGYLKAAYDDGWYEEDNPLTPYKEKYLEKMGHFGVIQTQNDLMMAIAFKTFGKN